MDGSAKFEYLRYMADTTDLRSVLRDLMQEHGNDVWNYAFSLCRSADMADEATQDVFLKVYRKLGMFRGESSVKTWLLAITRNTVFDMRRKSFWKRAVAVGLTGFPGLQRSAELEAIERLAVNDLWKKVMTLPVKYREVIILSVHYQLSIKEIAGILGLSEGTVKSRLHHARVKLLKMKERD